MAVITCEICIDSVAGARAAHQAGADRLELCANLLEGGTTPSLGMTEAVIAAVPLPVMVMIRCRGGDFCYSPEEVDVMRRDIQSLRQTGIRGIVIGALTPDGDVDQDVCQALVAAADGLEITFHRAFDVGRSPDENLESIIQLGCHRLLTSGCHSNAADGIAVIQQLVRQAEGRLSVMAGCGVSQQNVQRIIEQTGVREVHFSGSMTQTSPMRFRRTDVPMSSTVAPDEFLRKVTSLEIVTRICQLAKLDPSQLSQRPVTTADLDVSLFHCCGNENLFPFQCSTCQHPMVFCYECETLYADLHDLQNTAAEVNHFDADRPIFVCPVCGYGFESQFMRNPEYAVTQQSWLAANLSGLLNRD
ncbi:MAG: copper homeostasis protein CutC [Pirellulaceae bacterium]